MGVISSLICFVLNPYVERKINQKNIELEAMDATCMMLLDFFKQKFNNEDNMLELLMNIQDNIIVYGTKKELNLYKTIKIRAFQFKEPDGSLYTLVLLYLLFSVIRKETYKSSYFNPNYLYSIYLTDYQSRKEEIKALNNLVVKENHLGRKYYIK